MNDGHTPFCDMQGHGPMCGPCDHHCRGCVYQAERADAAVAELDELRTSVASRERAAAEQLEAVKNVLDEYCTAGCCQFAETNEKQLHDRLLDALGIDRQEDRNGNG